MDANQTPSPANPPVNNPPVNPSSPPARSPDGTWPAGEPPPPSSNLSSLSNSSTPPPASSPQNIPPVNPPLAHPQPPNHQPSETPPSDADHPNSSIQALKHFPFSIFHSPFIFLLFAVIIIIIFLASLLYFSRGSILQRFALKLPQIKFLQKLAPPAIQIPSITPVPSVPSINFSSLMTPANISATLPAGEAKPTLANQPTSGPSSSLVPSAYSLVPNLSGLHVPETGENPTDADIAIPISVSSAGPTTDSQIRTFKLTAEKNSFSPKKIIVYKNDIIRLRFYAKDGKYDFTVPALGISQTVKNGQTALLEFQPGSSGVFEFFCQECAKQGGKPAVSGTLSVVPRI